MGAITPTLIQEHHTPYTVKYGTGEKRLTKLYVEATSSANTDSIDLSTYVAGLSGIIGIEANSLDAADASNDTTLNTWSGTTITFAGHAGSGVWKLTVSAYY
jgi:hypothetical protein